MYQPLYNEKHKFVKSTAGDLVQDKFTRPSSGEYEKDLLCANCDNKIIGKLESYGKIIFDGNPTQRLPFKYTISTTNEGIVFKKYENVEYSTFKLFLLSILWRSSISGRDFFREVKLGSHEEIIRLMLLNHDPGEEDIYPVLIFDLRQQSDNYEKFIGQPRRLKQQSNVLYSFIVQGLLFIFKVSKNYRNKLIVGQTIKKSNEFTIVCLPPSQIDAWFLKLYGFKNITNTF